MRDFEALPLDVLLSMQNEISWLYHLSIIGLFLAFIFVHITMVSNNNRVIYISSFIWIGIMISAFFLIY